ncbi:MAG TPA: hypothetical protein VFF65_07270 [Phycisphaerales bacterium]|nr:hypothetical protein [Phycisphaerales bacterium]
MAGDDFGQKLKQVEPKTWVMAGVAAVLLIIFVIRILPEGPPQLDPTTQKAADAISKDPNANPPVPDVPPSADGPRRKATKAN